MPFLRRAGRHNRVSCIGFGISCYGSSVIQGKEQTPH